MPKYINNILDGSGASIVRAMIQNPSTVVSAKREYVEALDNLARVILEGTAEERQEAAAALHVRSQEVIASLKVNP